MDKLLQRPRVGVLAVQGDFEAHSRALQAAGADPVLVKNAGQLAGVQALVLPGGESTTVLKFLQGEGLWEAIQHAAADRMPMFGTCAGAILMAREATNPAQPSLGLVDISVRRNAYGRQISSFITREPVAALPGGPIEMVFIRAPIIERTGQAVEVLGVVQGKPVLVRQGRLIAATFHPELTADSRVHRYFLDLVGKTEASLR